MSTTAKQGFKATERIEAPQGGPGRGPMGGGMVGQKAMTFVPSAKRLAGRMRPDRGKALLVVLLGVASVTLMSVGPRILGHATDLVFNGFVGSQIPVGTPESQWPEAVQGADVVPGQGVDFTAVGEVLMLVLAIYAGASLLGWLSLWRRIFELEQRLVLLTRSNALHEAQHRMSTGEHVYDPAPRQDEDA